MDYGDFTPQEDNRPEGYSGVFIGKVYDSDNRRNFDVETNENGLSNHLHTTWHRRLPVTSKYGYQHRDFGDETVLDFFLERKMPNPPDFHFEMGNEQYVMKFKYSPQDGMKTTAVVKKTIKKKKKKDTTKSKNDKKKPKKSKNNNKGGRRSRICSKSRCKSTRLMK